MIVHVVVLSSRVHQVQVNHLACAIANQALQQRRSVVVITVAELMLKFR